MAFWRRLVLLLPWRRRAAEQDMQEELRSIASMAGAGELGNLTLAAEAARTEWTWQWVEHLVRDVRHSIRSLKASPGFTMVALAVLALAIGATTAIYSVVDHVVLRRLPFPAPDRLVAVGERHLTDWTPASQNLVAPQNYLDWRHDQGVFTGLAAIGYASITLRAEAGQEPETLEAQAVTSEFFDVLGVPPSLGQPFATTNEVDGNARVAVISYDLWQRRFNGRPDIVGRLLHTQRVDLEIVGVMPQGFGYPVGATRPTAVWIPNVFPPDEHVRGNEFSYRLHVIGRMRDNVSISQAQTAMDSITARLAARTPHWFTDRVALVEPLDVYVTRGVRGWMFMLVGAVVFVQLIACVILMNLLLVRLSARSRDVAVRSALGASRWDLARGLIVESLLLSIAGGTLGALLAWKGVDLLRAVAPAELPRTADIAVDLPVLVTMFAISTITGLLIAVAPLLHVWRPSGRSAATHLMRMTTASRPQQRLRGALVALEVALAVVLLVGAGLFLGSFARVSSVDLGLDPTNVLTVRVRPAVGPGGMSWAMAQQQNRGLLRNLADDVRHLPGVTDVALVGSGVPLRGDLRTIDFEIPGHILPPGQDLDFNEISPDYFRTMGVPLRRGRVFTDADRAGSEPVVIINEAAARKFFGDEDPLGQMVRFQGLRRVVGIAGNIRHDGPETDWRTQGFIPFDQSTAVNATLVARLSQDPSGVVPAIKNSVWRFFPGLALPDIQTLEGYLNALTAQRRFNMLLTGVFGVLAIAIAAIGIYGVMAYAVVQRTPEIGIRLALGAGPVAIQRSILGTAAGYLGVGLTAGMLGASFVSRLVSSFLFQTPPHDPLVYGAVVAVLMGAGGLAAFIPARRAGRLDPLVALRLE
jgi:putative ABC transport system permease protein